MRAKIDLGDLKPRTSDDQTEALPPWRKSLRVCLSKSWQHVILSTRHCSMISVNIRSLFVCGALILFTSVVYGAGSYQCTRDGQTLVWRDSPARGDEATWSGKRDKDGFATGSGVLTWYKVEPTIVTGSNILDTRRYAILINHYSGTMVRGKFKGAVTNIEADGKRLHASSVNRADRRSRRQKATLAATAEVRARATPTAEQTPTPSSERIIIDTPELTSALATPTPAPEQTPSPIAQEPQTAVPLQTATCRRSKWRPHRSQLQSRARPQSRKNRKLQCHRRQTPWWRSGWRPRRRSKKPGNLMPEPQLYRHQPRLRFSAIALRAANGLTEAAANCRRTNRCSIRHSVPLRS